MKLLWTCCTHLSVYIMYHIIIVMRLIWTLTALLLTVCIIFRKLTPFKLKAIYWRGWLTWTPWSRGWTRGGRWPCSSTPSSPGSRWCFLSSVKHPILENNQIFFQIVLTYFCPLNFYSCKKESIQIGKNLTSSYKIPHTRTCTPRWLPGLWLRATCWSTGSPPRWWPSPPASAWSPPCSTISCLSSPTWSFPGQCFISQTCLIIW